MIRKFAFSKLLAETKEQALPFVEMPSDSESRGHVEASIAEKLFSLFTADIIKQDVVFIR